MLKDMTKTYCSKCLRTSEVVDMSDCPFCKASDKIDKLLEPRQPKYKRVKMVMPHCPVCGEMLQGNNSISMPYKCSCGEWEGEWEDGMLYYKTKTGAL
jgi:glutaredoxin